MADATNFELLVAAGVGGWAMANTVFSVSEIMNKRRDAIIIGHLEGRPLSKQHKQLILWSDWLPMAAGLLFICLGGLGAAFIVSGYLEERFMILAGWLRMGSAALFIVVGLGLLISFGKEYNLIKVHI